VTDPNDNHVRERSGENFIHLVGKVPGISNKIEKIASSFPIHPGGHRGMLIPNHWPELAQSLQNAGLIGC